MVYAVLKHWHVVAATVLMTSQPLLTEASIGPDGSYEYSMISVTLFAELVKWLVSVCVYCTLSSANRSHASLRMRDVLHFSIPAAIYFVNNNIMFLIIERINSTQFQILSCLKTVFTALLFRAILCRVLSVTKWAAIVTLACGAASSQIQQTCAVGPHDEYGSGVELSNAEAVVGVVGTALSSLLSSFAGVYSELLLKKDAQLHSIHLQNALLYSWGLVFNSVGLAVFDGRSISNNGLLYGYNAWTWALLVNNAVTGLTISAVLKYTNNIVRVFAHTGAMVITASIGVLFLDAHATPQLPLAIMIVSASTVIYAVDGPLKPDPTARVFLERQRASAVELRPLSLPRQTVPLM
jgi:UDP-galactose transporter